MAIGFARPAGGIRHPLMLLLAIVALLAAGTAGWWLYFIRGPLRDSEARSQDTLLRMSALSKPVANKLDPRFTDADGDLVADAPTNANAFIDPNTLVFCYIAIDDPDLHRKAMESMMRRLSQVTGKPVEYLAVRSIDEQLQAMRDGRLHVAGFNTGSVPIAVNLCGFVPVATPGGPDGKALHQMEIIVPADSTAHGLADLRGREITLIVGSQSGYRAPLMALRDAGMLPQKDYTLRYSGGHHQSIAGVASGKYAAAAVANDVLRREIAAGHVQASRIRTIYRSESFPNAALGYVYNLKPELARKIETTLLEFPWKGTSMEGFFGLAGQTRFMPVSFKDDWALARRIDDEMGFVYRVP